MSPPWFDIELKGRTNIVALGITTEGVKIPLGLWEGSTENATVATALLADIVERGLDPEQGMLFVTDGARALRKAVRAVLSLRRVIESKEAVGRPKDWAIIPALRELEAAQQEKQP